MTTPEENRNGEENTSEKRGLWDRRRRAKEKTLNLLEQLEGLNSDVSSEDEVPYERARECCGAILHEDGETRTSFCRSRWCVICRRNNRASLINEYGPILDLWDKEDNVYLVTLTTENVGGHQLEPRIEEMKSKLGYCRRSIRDTRELDLRVVERWNVEFNDVEQTFNPHVHVAVRGHDQAVALKEEWLKRWEAASERAQDISSSQGDAGDVEGVVGYISERAVKITGEDRPPAHALDRIFRSLHRKHLTSSNGFDKEEELDRAMDVLDTAGSGSKGTSSKGSDSEENSQDGVWDWNGEDWYETQTGEVLV